nr:immunoglobulin light chain junction region [Macaca mulatta]
CQQHSNWTQLTF